MIRKLAENGVYFLCNSSLDYVVPVTITKSLFVTLNKVEGKYLDHVIVLIGRVDENFLN